MSSDKDKKLHVLLLNRSFWPDTEATGQFLTELCQELKEKYKITVIAGRSYYIKEKRFKGLSLYRKEIFDDIEVLRVRHTIFWKGNLLGRMANWLTYCILAFLSMLKMKPDVMIVCTDPPFLGIIAMIIGRLKSVPYIYNCRDLYPDVALALGKLKKGLSSDIFDYFNRKAFYSARFLVPLGQSMKNKLIKKNVPGEKIRIITDWVDTLQIKPIPKKENSLLEKFGIKNKFVIVYSGNIGLSQGFEIILDSIKFFPNDVHFVFIGEGAGKDALKNQAQSLNLKNILFLPYQPKEMLPFSLSMADLHVVPLMQGTAGTVVPSKLYGIMAVSRPYLAITDEESEPAILAKEFKCGLWAAPGNIKAVSDNIRWAIGHPKELEDMGSCGRKIAETRFDKKIVIKEWFKLLDNFNHK